MAVERCPVCGGNGLVPNGFYSQTSGCWPSTGTGGETCRSCGGKGYIVVPEEEVSFPWSKWFKPKVSWHMSDKQSAEDLILKDASNVNVVEVPKEKNVVVTAMLEIDLTYPENLANFPPKTLGDDLALAEMKRAIVEAIKKDKVRNVRIVRVKEKK